MKLLLAASLILNVLLFGAAIRRGTHGKPAQFARALRTQTANQSGALFQRSGGRAPVASVPGTPWQAVESRDPAQFIANLRAIGCPEQTIRDILVTRVSREFQARLQGAYDAAARAQPWWRGSSYSLELSQLRPTLRRERDDLIEQLFGEPANRLISQILATPGGSAIGREFLSADRRQPLREIEARYARLMAETTMPVGEPLDDEERAALAELNHRKRAEIEALLTPQELEELDLRESATARYVLSKLPGAQSEADFRLMFQAAREGGAGEDTQTSASLLARRYGLGPGRITDDLEQVREAGKRSAIEARAKELLGEQRFAQLQQAEAAREATQQARWEAEQHHSMP
jgi:hypothetical protein